jgi:hypothetical protein
MHSVELRHRLSVSAPSSDSSHLAKSFDRFAARALDLLPDKNVGTDFRIAAIPETC